MQTDIAKARTGSYQQISKPWEGVHGNGWKDEGTRGVPGRRKLEIGRCVGDGMLRLQFLNEGVRFWKKTKKADFDALPAKSKLKG